MKREEFSWKLIVITLVTFIFAFFALAVVADTILILAGKEPVVKFELTGGGGR